MFDILVAGEINADLILSGDVVPEFDQVEELVDSAALTLGSSSAIFACGAARLGLKVAFITDVFLPNKTENVVDTVGAELVPAQLPRYVIGTEFPIPGGGHEHQETVNVTNVQDVEQTMKHIPPTFKQFAP